MLLRKRGVWCRIAWRCGFLAELDWAGRCMHHDTDIGQALRHDGSTLSCDCAYIGRYSLRITQHMNLFDLPNFAFFTLTDTPTA